MLGFRKRRATGLIPEPFAGVPVTVAARQAVAASSPPTVARMWGMGPVLDQGNVGACVGFAQTCEAVSEPQGQVGIATQLGNTYALNHFRRARVLAGQTPDETPTSTGSSLHYNMQVAQDRGLIEGYRTITDVEDLANTVVNEGPVVLCLRWIPSFEKTRDNGLMPYVQSEADRGWHAVCVTGYDPARPLDLPDLSAWKFVWRKVKNARRRRRRNRKRDRPNRRRMIRVQTTRKQPPLPPEPMLLIRNSWGDSWGATVGRSRNGTGWLRARDLRHMWDSGDAYAYAPITRLPVDLAAALAAHPDPYQPPTAVTT